MTLPRTTPRRSTLSRDDAFGLARTEYDRFAEAVAALTVDDWPLPTVCPGWTVHDLVAHVVGMAHMAASPLELARQMRAAKARRPAGTPLIDSLTAHQVEKYGGRGDAELVRLAAAIGPKAAKGRARVPGFVRNRSLPEPELVGGVPEEWTMGFLLETVLTRDTWMHRSDLAEATGNPMQLAAEHDGRIVADLVRDWAGRHGQPFHLTLTGPAGGTWADGEAEPLELDAVEFCRILSGRGRASGLLTTQIPF